MFRTALTDFFSGNGKSLAYVGTALVLTGVGTATAAAASYSPPAQPTAGAVHRAAISDSTTGHDGDSLHSKGSLREAGQHGSKSAAHHSAAHSAAHKAAAHKTAAHKTAAHKTAAHKTAAHASHHAKPAHHAAARHAGKRAHAHVVVHRHHVRSWKQIRDMLAGQTYPRAAPHKLPLFDRLKPAAASGGQAYLPMTASRTANATTIVREALRKHMGLRSAVIAVATAMQESTLENITYGDRDSLGLFQQRPSTGWGTPAQVTDPTYAADAFLSALHSHQAADPSWAAQPLWENAQSVQRSGFPYAYAKWENQAAQVVSQVASRMY
jgi:hypothetical protein